MPSNQQSTITALELLRKDIAYIKADLTEIKQSINDFKKDYVTQKEFDSHKWLLRTAIAGLIANSIALLYK